MYLLDTNACIRLLNGTSEVLAARMQKVSPTAVQLCAIVKAELLYGARHSDRVERNLALLKRFFTPFVSLPFDDRCAEEYGLLRAELARAGTPIGPSDMMIVAIARCRDLTLVTHNIREFSRVAGLRLEDWEDGTPSR
jgi:tRNA(fMet)-specific endonuclease VapC